MGGYWVVGVAASEKIWAIYMCECTDIVRELTPKDCVKVVSEELFPQKVRVLLDYEQGILSFFDLDRKTLVHTIKHHFTDPVFPFFFENAKILQSELLVEIRQSR